MNPETASLPIQAKSLALFISLLWALCIALPLQAEDSTQAIQLSTFSVRLTGNETVIIEWITERESGNDYYLIERSSDSVYWDVLGEVGGSGDSEIPIRYTFLDKTPLQGKAIYRLKQISTNTDYSFPAIQAVDLDLKDPGLQILKASPNPFTDQFAVYFSTQAEVPVDIRLYDSEGQVLMRKQLTSTKGVNTFPVSFSTPPPDGLYVVSMTSREQHLRTYLMIKGSQFVDSEQTTESVQPAGGASEN